MTSFQGMKFFAVPNFWLTIFLKAKLVTKFDNAINSVLINGKIVQQRIAI